MAYFYCYSPPGQPAALATLVQVAGARWQVEEDFRTGKDHFGLDHSQVRLYTALLRHLTLTTAALAICTTTAAAMRHSTNTLPPAPTKPDQQPPTDPGLIPLTVAEIKRLYNLLTHTAQDLAHHLRWAWWRRRHQARARWFHHRTRLRRRLLNHDQPKCGCPTTAASNTSVSAPVSTRQIVVFDGGPPRCLLRYACTGGSWAAGSSSTG